MLTDEQRTLFALLSRPLSFNNLKTETAATGPCAVHPMTLRKTLNNLLGQKLVKEDRATQRGKKSIISITEKGRQYLIQTLGSNIYEILKVAELLVTQVMSDPSLRRNLNEELRQQIIEAKDIEERLLIITKHWSGLHTLVKRVHELLLWLKGGNLGNLTPKDIVENQLLIFDHSHNALIFTPKDETSLNSMTKFLKEQKLIT